MIAKLAGVILCVGALGACPQKPAVPATPAPEKARHCSDANELTLPAGFCASVFADGLGTLRHLTVNDNGDVYAAIRGNNGNLVALRDSDGDGVADETKSFGQSGGTGIGIRDGYLYFATQTSILRYRLKPDELLPETDPEVVVAGFIEQRQHATKTIAFDGEGGLYTNIGAPSNACQDPPRSKETAGLDPCPQLDRQAGIWRFAADDIGQDAYSDGQRYATGIRNAVANAWHPGTKRLYAVQHGRDQLSELWPNLYTDEQRAELPAEEFFAVDENDDFGWPYCFYDHLQGHKVLAPEYGGDGKKSGRCDAIEEPLVAFPGHWAPNDLLFYEGRQFPSKYRHGAFIAFHGSWNRAPFSQQGFKVVFVPFREGAPSGKWETFADGFAPIDHVRGSREAKYRPTGLAAGPDGHLYIADSLKGRIWRVRYAKQAESTTE